MKRGMQKDASRGGNMLFILFLFAIFLLPFSFMQASDVFATASTITLSITDKVGLNIASLDTTGTFVSSDTETNNISVLTNNGTGYLLGIKASTEGGNALVNATDSSKTIPSHTISAGVSKTNYNDASYASANNLNNTWGFRPSTYYDTANNVTIDNTTSNLYFPGPSSATNQFIIDKTSSANATANEYNIALGTRISNSTSPGRYTNVFVITAVANPILYSITYNQNTTDTVTNMPSNVVDQPTFDETVNIDSTVPARDGFNFKGWCTAQVADGGTCSGTIYNPDGEGADLNWTLDQTATSNSLSLYARWKISTNPYCTNWATCMQNTETPPACGTTMTDGRDGATYTTATIGGACWMTQNLRFQGTDLKVGESDVTSDITMTYGQLTSGDSYTEPRIATGSTTDYGTYYNICAASAGEVCNDTTRQDATRSVCPAGWKLPTQAQLNALPSKDSHFTASSGLAGLYDGGSLDVAGTRGFWWASTAYDATRQSRLFYNSDFDIWLVSLISKYYGYSVRCIRAS